VVCDRAPLELAHLISVVWSSRLPLATTCEQATISFFEMDQSGGVEALVA
jgi:hypothetical protein